MEKKRRRVTTQLKHLDTKHMHGRGVLVMVVRECAQDVLSLVQWLSLTNKRRSGNKEGGGRGRRTGQAGRPGDQTLAEWDVQGTVPDSAQFRGCQADSLMQCAITVPGWWLGELGQGQIEMGWAVDVIEGRRES